MHLKTLSIVWPVELYHVAATPNSAIGARVTVECAFQIGNHDQHRVASRYGPELVDGLNMLAQLLPGSGITYNGEEIGMEDADISFKDTVDPAGRNAGSERYELFSRDPERTPFQWDDTIDSGQVELETGVVTCSFTEYCSPVRDVV